MDHLLSEYFPIFLFLIIATLVPLLAMGSSIFVSKITGNQKPDANKLSPYECGFDAFEDAHQKFDVRFYLVAILFVIFDLEVAFLYPWAVSLGAIGALGFWSMMVFLLVLTVGFIYEWKTGALDWE